jgi:hypothetical protein
MHAHHKSLLLEAVQDMYGDIMNTCFQTMARLPSFPATPELYVRTQHTTATNSSGTASLTACHLSSEIEQLQFGGGVYAGKGVAVPALDTFAM